jgi:hypothetical protein
MQWDRLGKQTVWKGRKPAQRQFYFAESYIKIKPIERQEALDSLRRVIKMNLPEGFQGTIQYG